MKNSWFFSHPLSEQRRFRSNWADALVDLPSFGAHPFYWFSHEVAHLRTLKEPDTLNRLFIISDKGDQFYLVFCLLFCALIPFEKGIFSEKKKMARTGSRFFFSFREEPLSDKSKDNFDRIVSFQSVSVSLNSLSKLS